jgi:hypothetical protein
VGFTLRSLLVVALAVAASACWQHTDVHREGQVRGFVVGATKRATFDSALRAQRDGRVRALLLLDEPYETYAEKYKGAPILESDFERVAARSSWQVNLAECNCWVRLYFEGDVVAQIEESEWTGPTK